ncbi:hypothetical protein [Streptomyces cellulosae]|uniref:hypothetical protein n=1 Tax=Streptomyces cellulosae TaxID=1968 RepID=UPI000D146DFB|nr:hypothetical protein [Streptomyces cellulosae]
MGIRMLHRRRAQGRTQAQVRARAASAPSPPLPPVPALSAAASTARVPTGLVTALRRMTAPSPATGLRRTAATGLVPGSAPGSAPGSVRIAAHLAQTVRRAAAALRYRFVERDRDAGGHGREAPVWRLWAGLGRRYLGLALTLLPRSRPLPTITVFTAVNGRPGRSAPQPPPYGRPPGRDATP